MTATLSQRLAQTVASLPDNWAFIEAQRSVSYRELGAMIDAVGSFVASRINRGDRVALLLENSAEYAAACYGVWRAGGAVVGLNTALKARDIANLLQHSGATLLIADASQRELKAAIELLGHDCGLLLVGGDAEAPAGASHWRDALAAPPTVQFPSPAADELAAIIYTSGTTGHPKGVALTHGNLAANMSSIQQYLPIGSDDRMLCVLPFYYSYGNSVLHSHLSLGATLILENSLMYPHKVLSRMAEQRATAFAGVPSTFYLLLARTKLDEFDLSSLRYCTQAGGGMDKAKIAQWLAVMPQSQFFVMYGQTEASARLTWLPPDQLTAKAGSIGVAIPGVELCILTENGSEAATGETGEVCARGANVMQGYWRDADETANVLRDGWLHTGDLGYRDADGFYFLIGRNKEMIKTGAHRVSPREIEELISTVAGVDEVAVVGVADDVMGQVIKACVIARGDHDELRKQIQRVCREQLAMYKIPKQVAFYDTFPKTASGKVQKHLLG